MLYAPSPALPSALVCQRGNTAETRTAVSASLISDLTVIRANTADLINPPKPGEPAHPAIAALRSGALPIGDVPFVQAAAQAAGVTLPGVSCYPSALRGMLGRKVVSTDADAVVGWARAAMLPAEGLFVKPVRTKLFTGFVLNDLVIKWGDNPAVVSGLRSLEADPESAEGRAAVAKLIDASSREGVDPHALAEAALQWASLQACLRDEPVWVSPAVEVVAEWRLYVQGAPGGYTALAEARYDPCGPHDLAPPPASWAAELLALAATDPCAPASLALDVGWLRGAKGELLPALIEVNDAWALGLYGRCMSPLAWVQFLWTRWDQLRNNEGGSRA